MELDKKVLSKYLDIAHDLHNTIRITFVGGVAMGLLIYHFLNYSGEEEEDDIDEKEFRKQFKNYIKELKTIEEKKNIRNIS